MAKKMPLFLDKMDKNELRAACTERDILWSKQADTEATLRSKLKNYEQDQENAKEEDDAAGAAKTWDLTKRSEPEEIINVKTGEVKIRPVDCFGWLFLEGGNECGVCPHAVPCAKLTATAPLDQLDDETKGEASLENIGKVEAAPEKPKTIREPKLSEKTKVRAIFADDINCAEELAGFYKRLRRKKDMTVKDVIDVFEMYFEVDDRAQIVKDLVAPMIENKELEVLK